MSGPTLKLNVTAPGRKSVEDSVSAVERLAAALRTLPAASAELQKLQRQLAGAQAPAGLKTGAGNLKELVGEIKNLGAQLSASFGSLEETIKKGWRRAAAAQGAGAARARSSGITVTSVGAAGNPIEVPLGQFAKFQVGALRIAESQREALRKLETQYQESIQTLDRLVPRAIKAATQPGYRPAGAEWWTKVLESQEAARVKLETQYQKLIQTLDRLVSRTIKAATQPGYRPAGAEWWTKVLESQEAALLKLQLLESRFAASSNRARLNVTLQARALLDQGATPATVSGVFGNSATAAAQATTFARLKQQVEAAGTAAVAVKPRIEGLSGVMRDLHSGARGVASGFNQMALTWGALGPLLVGAALSNSFVQALKQGAKIRQEFETIRVLSTESATAVAGLEAQMLSLARTGPAGPLAIAEGMRVLSLAGLSVKEVALAIKPALDLAITGQIPLEKAAESLAAVGTAFSFSAGNFSAVADQITKAAAISMSSVSSMTESFRASTVIAQAYGVTLEDTATSLAVLANIGIRGSAAGVALRQAYSELSGATRKTRDAMAALGVSVIDSSGNMKGLLPIAESLSLALDKLTGPDRLKAIQALANQRGSKAVVGIISAFAAESKDGSASSELARLRELQGSAAGFNALSAVKLSLTPLKLMEGAVASFQAALNDAFRAIEDKLVVVSVRLREVFNSQEFSAGVSSLVSAVTAATETLVLHAGWLKTLGLLYVGFKGLQLFQLSLQALTAAQTLLAERALIAAAAQKALEAGAVAAAPAMTKLATATAVLGTTLRVLGPLAIALTAATFLWDAYKRAVDGAKTAEEDAGKIRNKLTIEGLDREIARLRTVEEELRKGKTLRLAELEAKKKEAEVERLIEFEKRREPLRQAFVEKRDALDLAVENSKGNTPTARGFAGLVPIRQKELAQAQRALDVQASEFAATQAEIAFKTSVVQGRQDVVTSLDQENRAVRPTGTQTFQTLGAGKAQAGQELAALKRARDAAEQDAQAAFSQQEKILNIQLRGRLISENEFTVQLEEAAQKRYDSQIAALDQFVKDSEPFLVKLQKESRKALFDASDLEKEKQFLQQRLENLRGAAGSEGAVADLESQLQALSQRQAELRQGSVTARNIVAEEAENRKRVEQNLKNLREATTAQREADTNLARVRTGDSLATLQKEVDLQRAKFKADQDTLGLTPGAIAAADAIEAVRVKGVTALKPLVDKISLVQLELDRLTKSAPTSDPKVAAKAEELAQLNAALSQARSDLERIAQDAGTASKNIADAGGEAWRQFIAAGQNANTVLTSARNDFMQGWLTSGQSVWENWLTTGKLSISNLKQLFVKTLADITFQKILAKPFSELGQGLFNTALVPVAGLRTGTADRAGLPEAGRELGKIVEDLAGPADSLKSALSGVGDGLFRLLLQAGNGLAALLSSIGANQASSFITGLLGAFAGSGSGGAGAPFLDAGTPSPGVGPVFAANGAAFNGNVQLFKQGAALLNSVVSQPHAFRFGAGGSQLGILGEAGPEAILPLSRGPGGELGVRATGGGGSRGGNVSVVIENHGNGEQPQVTREAQPDGGELIRVVLNATAKDISRGGPVRKSLQSAVKTTPNLPRF